MISRKMIVKILRGNFVKVFVSVCNMIFRHFVHKNFFMFILLVSNHTDTVFLVQFGIDLHLWVFHKAELAIYRRGGSYNFSF